MVLPRGDPAVAAAGVVPWIALDALREGAMTEPRDQEAGITGIELVRLRIIEAPPDPATIRSIRDARKWVASTGRPFVFIFYDEGTEPSAKQHQVEEIVAAITDGAAAGGHE